MCKVGGISGDSQWREEDCTGFPQTDNSYILAQSPFLFKYSTVEQRGIIYSIDCLLPSGVFFWRGAPLHLLFLEFPSWGFPAPWVEGGTFRCCQSLPPWGEGRERGPPYFSPQGILIPSKPDAFSFGCCAVAGMGFEGFPLLSIFRHPAGGVVGSRPDRRVPFLCKQERNQRTCQGASAGPLDPRRCRSRLAAAPGLQSRA